MNLAVIYLLLIIQLFCPSSSLKSKEYFGDSSQHLFYFVHVTDIHVTHFGNVDRMEQFEQFCSEIIRNLIKPPVVVVTGDLTHSRDQKLGSQQYEIEWQMYNDILKRSKVTESTKWLDIRGNHDSFMDDDLESNQSFYRIYSPQGQKTSGSYRYEIKTLANDVYSFIGVDFCPRPGPGRPFNFLGQMSQKEMKKVDEFAKQSENSTATIYFGHYPLSFTYSNGIDRLMNGGIVYLNGHLHSGFGRLYFRHSNGLIELELGDWKDNRRFRLITIDSGLLSFGDFHFNQRIYGVISHPKPARFQTNREPLERLTQSSHIRILIFSKESIDQVKIWIDSIYLGEAHRSIENANLFVLKWNSTIYNDENLHEILVEILDKQNEILRLNHEFSLSKVATPKLSEQISNRLILFIHWPTFGLITIMFTLCVYILILILFRHRARRMIACRWSCFTICNQIRQRMIVLCSVDIIYYSLISLSFYHFLGPWYIGYLTQNQFGYIFLWGTIVGNVYLLPDMQLFMGTIQLLFYLFPLTLCLSSSCFDRYNQLQASFNLSESCSHRFIRLVSVYILFLYAFIFLFQWLFAATASYQFACILSPFGLPLAIFSLFLYGKSRRLTMNQFQIHSNSIDQQQRTSVASRTTSTKHN